MAHGHGVEILETTQITLRPPSSSPPPPPVKLSFLDTFWVMFPPVQKLILYLKPANDLPFPSILEALKSSLSATLLDYPPLSGMLTYNPTSEEVEIDLSDPSVDFIVAESDLDLKLLAGNEIHEAESFMKLVPRIDVTVLPFRAFAVQVTRFGCGGIAIGYAVHHAVVDGKPMFEFIEAWAAACRAKLGGTELPTREPRRKPPYDRSAIQYSRGVEISKKHLRTCSPNLPVTGVPSLATIEESRLVNKRRTFQLDASQIQSLKQRATESRPPSTFLVIAAYTWACYARTRSLDPSWETTFSLLMDCRSRLNPPLDGDFFANCLVIVFVTMPVSELIGEHGLARACTVLKKSIDTYSEDPFRCCEYLVETLMSYMGSDRIFNVSASPRFQVYKTDFGWGKPARFESVSMNRDGEFALVGGKEDGSVQVSVAVNPEQLEVFENLFLEGLGA